MLAGVWWISNLEKFLTALPQEIGAGVDEASGISGEMGKVHPAADSVPQCSSAFLAANEIQLRSKRIAMSPIAIRSGSTALDYARIPTTSIGGQLMLNTC